MAYYTEEDRKRAAAKRKMNSQFRQLMKSPEDAYDIMGVSVPRVLSQPQLADYGLHDDVEATIAALDEKSKADKKSVRLIFFWLGIIVPAIIAGFYSGVGTFFGVLFLLPVGGFMVYLPWYFWASDPKPDKTSLHTQYDGYKTQISYYEYWQRKKNKDHWNTMSGHGFEQAVAGLFRNIGFTTQISNAGGDGGVDIILQKGDRKIAVQCKRYKSAVGPHVIRDLWGTMHYLGFTEGCIVTTTGFTRGVVNFAKDKPIFLVDLNDILKATTQADGDRHLRRQIGEPI